MALRKVKLYGKLGRLFGREWEIDVETVGEAIHAIDINTNGRLSEYFLRGEGRNKYYKVGVKKKKNLVSPEELRAPFGSGDIYIMPTIRGGSAVARIVIGVVLLVASIWFPPLAGLGIAMLLGGLSELLAPHPKNTPPTRSYLFQGNQDAILQGGAVPIVYGRALVSPLPVCISETNSDQTSTFANTYVATTTTKYLPGGGVQYNVG